MIPIILGSAVAWGTTHTFLWEYFLLTIIAGIFIHIGTNVANDYFDHKSGNDEINTEYIRPFSGGSRVIQLGLLTPKEVLRGAFMFLILSGIIGVYLAIVRGPIILLLGIIGVFSGFFYTAPPFNLASRGVGEVFVGLNFGILMTLGAFYVQTQTLTWECTLAAVPIALLIAAVLYINQFPDYKADKAVGKKHLVVRLGTEKAAKVYGGILIAVYALIVLGVTFSIISPFTLIALITLPLAIKGIRHARAHHSKPLKLIPANASTILTHLLVGLLLAVGYILEGLELLRF
ncbi:MAG: 1,4-dihydroxy-2-naphthoate octaprenyltransferase [Candidatus Bathyarchaeota archaeon]